MKLKQFLKPDWRKIVVFVVLFILTSLYAWEICSIYYKCASGNGFPLQYIGIGEFQAPIGYKGPTSYSYFDFKNLIIDLIFWYLVSCFIVWIYDKIRRVKKK